MAPEQTQDMRPPIETLDYERARDELVEIVRRLETGQAPLEQTLDLWERGEALAAHCRSILEQAQSRLDRATAQGQQAPANEGVPAQQGQAQAAGPQG